MTTTERVLAKVDTEGPVMVLELGPCHVWTASRDRYGYGSVSVDGRLVKAHRWLWEQANGPVPDDLELDHLCRNPPCVNPLHLEPVTHRENMMRGLARIQLIARNEARTHCKRGHEFTPENTYWYHGATYGRACRECMRMHDRNRKGKR
jgi:HNH endonuclease